MKSDDIVPFLTPPGRGPVGMRQGTLLAWDPSTGNNTVLVAGQTFTDLPVLAAGSVSMAPGDIVALQRYGNSYFILGAIRNAGTGSLQVRSAKVVADEITTSTSYGDLTTPGPSVDAYIGRSSQALVILSASVAAPTADYAQMNVVVSGASSIAASDINIAYLGTDAGPMQGTPAAVIQFTAANGLSEGINTFKAVYKSQNGVTGGCHFRNRILVVIPY